MYWVLIAYVRYFKQAKDPLGPRGDVVEFGVSTDKKYLKINLNLQGLPSDLEDIVKEVVKYSSYVFCEGVFLRPIRGFLFHFDTSNYPTIWCKPPIYGTHDSKVMHNLVLHTDENSLVKYYSGP